MAADSVGDVGSCAPPASILIPPLPRRSGFLPRFGEEAARVPDAAILLRQTDPYAASSRMPGRPSPYLRGQPREPGLLVNSHPNS